MNEENLKSLKAALLSIRPGTDFQVDWFLVNEFTDEDVARLLSEGAVWYGDEARLKKMARSNCHMNTMKTVMDNKGWFAGTGLALSEDGCWRVHSWCFNTRGRIVETTLPRTIYFGVVKSGREFVQHLVDASKRSHQTG